MKSSRTLLTTTLATFLFAGLVACTEDPPPAGGGTGGRTGTGGSGTGGSGTGGSGTGGSGTGGSATGGMTGTGGSGTGGAGSGGTSAETGAETTTETGTETGAETGTEVGGADLAAGVSPMTSFFITSRRGSADFGGLTQADKICQDLAAAVGLGAKTWKAYLSSESPMVNAKDRIGTGPWYNAKGVKIADDVAGLHTPASNMINGANGLTESGTAVPTGNPQEHDIITGTNADGTVAMGKTCTNWTGVGEARVGHHNRMGGMNDGGVSSSWVFAHDSNGCTLAQFMTSGGAGRFYCFATTP